MITFKDRFYEFSSNLLIEIVFLTGIGLAALYSISLYQDTGFLNNSFFKQVIYILPAVVGLLIALFTPRYIIHKYIYFLYFIIIGGIILPYFSRVVVGTHRWIDLGPIGLQPSEFAKWILVITIARYLSNRNLEMQRITALFIPILITLIPAVIILKQPDLGTALIMMTPVLPMLYWAGARPYYLFLLIAPILSILTAFHTIPFTIWCVVLALIIYLARPKLVIGVFAYFGNIFLGLLAPIIWNMLHEYQQKRLLTLFDPDLDPLGAAYQIIQSQTAIGSGGFLGKGWGQGTQTHLKFLPVQESDFILSVIGEEFGFIVIALIIGVFSLMILKIIKLAYNSKDRFSSLVLVGIATIFLAHIFINSAMTIGLIPVKGLPLPFISYGGSFLVSCYIMIGLVLNLGINPPE